MRFQLAGVDGARNAATEIEALLSESPQGFVVRRLAVWREAVARIQPAIIATPSHHTSPRKEAGRGGADHRDATEATGNEPPSSVRSRLPLAASQGLMAPSPTS